MGPKKYATYVSRSVTRFADTAKRLYLLWLGVNRKTPYAFYRRRMERRKGLVRPKPKSIVLGRKRSTRGWSCLASLDTPYEGDWKLDVFRADDEVSRMYSLQFPEADVWDRWANLQGSHFGGASELGVLVLYATQVCNSVQLLGAQRGIKDRLARPPEQLSGETAEDLNKLVAQA